MSLTIALPKGRMADDSIGLFSKASIVSSHLDFSGRALSVVDKQKDIVFYLVRSQDVATYVEHGIADMGIVGKDVLLEQQKMVYEILDLAIGYCRISLAGLGEKKPKHNIRVATKYPRITESFFATKNIDVEIIKLYGSVELAPMTGLADFIVDLVSTGHTLQANGLCEMETILESTGRLVVNRAAYVLKNERIQDTANKIRMILAKSVH